MTIDFDELLNLWSQYKELKAPPAEAVRLWSDGGCGIWISDSWGPAVPYPSVDHGDGTRNFGYRRLKGNTSVVIPEAQEWPELQAFLKKVNAESSPIESVGCEASFFEGTEGSPPVRLGSYIDIIFTDARLNDDPKSLLLLAHTFAKAVEDCDRWWANVSFALQRNRALTGQRCHGG